MDNSNSYESDENSIAIIGMAGRFPDAKTLDEFWENLKNGVESITFFSDSELLSSGIDAAVLKAPNYVKAKGILDNVAEFDAAFFDFSPKEAEITDPQQRLFLECAWEALENAGYDPKHYPGAIGVYGGVSSTSTYFLHNLHGNSHLTETIGDYQIRLSNDKDFLCTRISHKLDLKGPSVTVQTACSTSLVAVVMACQSLLDYQCDMVLAGGVTISFPVKSGYFYQEGMIMSPDGHCRAFDAKAQGTVDGNGAGIVVLKRLEDALRDGDHISAIIKGAAINNDGALKSGYTAPSVEGQTQLIIEVLTLADISPQTVTYVEAHGTGTPLGDPIEIEALTHAFRSGTQEKNYCAIGSVKTNLGHLDAAAGIAGFIKTVLALKHQLLPPSLHFEQPNPQIDFANSPFYVNTQLQEWKTDGIPRRAGVSSFGVGGTNAHLILEQAPILEPSGKSRSWQLLVVSAKTASALNVATANLATHLEQHPDLNLADVAYTLSKGRSGLSQRRMLVCQENNEAIVALHSLEPKSVFTHLSASEQRPIVFMFSGQGTQYVNMGLALYESEAAFREQVDFCSEYLKSHLGLDLRQVLYPTENTSEATQQLNQTVIAQSALFVIEYALAKLWMSWGIYPEAMIGHSIGEYVAACLAGVFSVEEALLLVAVRGQMMQKMPSGAMLAISLPEQQVQYLLGKELSLAAINAPSRCVVSGPINAIDSLENQLTQQEVECSRLHTSHAFHSKMMNPLLDSFLKRLEQVHYRAPQIPYLSNVTGTWMTAVDATNPRYWANHLRQSVRFADGIQQLLTKSERILLEIGPGRTLSTLTRRHLDKGAEQVILSSLRHPQDIQSDIAFLLNTLGKLWLAGGLVDWSGFYANERRHRVPLPTYPFERQRYWVEPQKPVIKEEQQQLQHFWQAVVATAHEQAQRSISVFDNPTYLKKKSCLERLCVAYMGNTMKSLGAFSQPAEKYSIETFLTQFKIMPRYQQLVSRWWQVLVENGQLQQDGDSVTNLQLLTTADFQTLLEEAQIRWADEPHWLEHVMRCGNHAVPVLTGNQQPLELFSLGNPDLETTKKMIQESPLIKYYNTILQTSMQKVVKLLPLSAHLKILEIGAGTGYATSVLLPVLPPQRTHYTFTDVGRFFLMMAEQKFSQYPFLEYGLLNIEQSPQEQGYKPHSFDVIVAVNMLHVTQKMNETLAHVRSLMVPNGLFLIWEITQAQLDFDITDGLLMGPLNDGERNQGNPFLSKEQWQHALQMQGFAKVKAVPETDVLGHHVIVAQADSSGEIIAPSAFTNLRVQEEMPSTVQMLSSKRPDLTDWFYKPSWKKSLISTSSQVNQQPMESCTLVFYQEYSLCFQLVQQMESQNAYVICVKIGATFAKLNDRLYTVNPRQANDYEALLKELQLQNKHPQTIVHFWTITSNNYSESQLETLDNAQTLGFYSLLFFAQAVGRQNVTAHIQIAVVSNYLHFVTGSEKICPEKATVLGPIRSIPQEYQHINCRSIDVILPDVGSPLEKELVGQLISEITIQAAEQIIAFRDHQRWVQHFESTRLEASLEQIPPLLRKGGVYLITGGLGGIGLVLAEYLVNTVQAKLILTGRSAIPNRDEWPQWLSNHHAQDSTSRKIRKIQELEQLGAEIWAISADVTDLEKMQTVVISARKRFGQIHGVIHAAGVYPEGLIQLKTPELVENLLAPKVRGTLVLDSVLKDFQLDFLVLCSSLSAISGGIVDHCGANAFLDAFAHYNTFQHDKYTISINWDGWQEVGQAAEAATRQYGVISQSVQEKAIAHPLFDKCLIKGTQAIYVTYFSVQKHWVLDEHRVMAKPTLPGTAYLEMARAAFENHTHYTGTIELQDVYFLTPLIIEEDGEIEVRTILKPQKEGFEFVILSQSKLDEEQWLEHANGKIARLEIDEPTQYDLQNLAASCHQETIVVKTKSQLVNLGPRWDNHQQVNVGNHQELALLVLPEQFTSELDTYKLHPALMDSATGFMTGRHEDDYLPFSYKRLIIREPLPAKLYSHIRCEENSPSQTDTLTFQIKILDEEGRGLVEIEDYILRKIDSEKIEARQKTPLISDNQNFYLEIVTPGLLDTLMFRPVQRQKPGVGEVEIEVCATGLNFMEVLITLGMLPFPTNQFGLECTGKIVTLGKGVDTFKIGDEVMAFASSCLSAFTTTSASLIVPKPEHLSLEEAATIPATFTTAYYALVTLGQLSQGKSVLIHAAAGGVGMAAVQIAQMLGTKIFATAGNPEKRAFLHSLGIEHVMDSRTLTFADQVMKLTNGRGVDVVLNSLSGEFIPKSLSVLAPQGRFLELGKRDIFENSRLGLRIFEKGLSFFVVKLETPIPILLELMPHFQDGTLKPLPYKVFPITEVVNAFQYMAQAKHIGKIVVSLSNKDAVFKQISDKPTVHRLEKVEPSNDVVSLDSPITVTNVFQKGLNEYLLPTEGVEVFSRILNSKLSQVLVSTVDLHYRLEQGSFSSLLNELQESKPAMYSSKLIHPRTQLSNAYIAPRNELERKIANIWQEFLGIEQVGIYDDFFEMGGDSLLAVQLIAKLRKTLQTNLSPHTLLNSPNIATLSEFLNKTISEPSKHLAQPTRSSLWVQIQKGSHRKLPIVLIHPIGGFVYFYRDLANHLGIEQPVYAIPAQGLDGQTEPLTRIEDMATFYVEILRNHQPQGPYFIGGASLGGMIAFEMAQQLHAIGQSVALMTMMDTPEPGPTLAQPETDAEIFAYLLKEFNVSGSVEELQKLEPDEKIRFFLENKKMANKGFLDLTQIRHIVQIFKANLQAMWLYKPKVYPGQVIFFRAKDEESNHQKNPEQAWAKWIAGGLDVIDIPGNHITMNFSPNVQIMAERLRTYLPT